MIENFNCEEKKTKQNKYKIIEIADIIWSIFYKLVWVDQFYDEDNY